MLSPLSPLAGQLPRVVRRHLLASIGTHTRNMATLPDYESFLTQSSKARKPSPIRALTPLLSIPGMISLGGGLPNPVCFPFASMDLTLRTGEKLSIEGKDLAAALQYSESRGLPPLRQIFKKMLIAEHSPKMAQDQWDLCITTGSQDGLGKVLEMLVDRGDNILVESPTYSGTLGLLRPLGCNLIGVATDGQGLVPESMEQILTSWDSRKQGPKPRVLYTIPCGSNPTGASMSVERRQKVLKLATEHDMLVVEDDPYYYLQIDGKLPSLFSMCEDGRVIRSDSLSKVLSSGLRIGFVSAPIKLLERVELHQQVTVLHTSGLSQAVVLALLQHWERQGNGWDSHIKSVVELYRERRDKFMAIVEKHLKGKAEWTVPQAGMFVWFRLCGVEDTRELIETKARDKKVILLPGNAFMPNGEPSPYVRASYSTASYEDMESAISRFASLVDDLQK
eukprot:comp12292_c0_seq1/m.7123 comp12292_c0_seq1/g.7123  ORF comp12292_c0_seq1/g.7123 comp12292_c0_seq1/m.7123 type:complete len:450 (-) comp12292_c0_seq1:161-1510(-)